MTLKDFVTIARAYQTIDCEFKDNDVVEQSFELMRYAYNSLSAEDKDIVNVLCDARLTDLL